MSNLLVIGNGFDLSAGAKTKYSHFFESDYYSEYKESVEEWIDTSKRIIDQTIDINTINGDSYCFNSWDLLFNLESKNFFCLDKKALIVLNGAT